MIYKLKSHIEAALAASSYANLVSLVNSDLLTSSVDDISYFVKNTYVTLLLKPSTEFSFEASEYSKYSLKDCLTRCFSFYRVSTDIDVSRCESLIDTGSELSMSIFCKVPIADLIHDHDLFTLYAGTTITIFDEDHLSAKLTRKLPYNIAVEVTPIIIAVETFSPGHKDYWTASSPNTPAYKEKVCWLAKKNQNKVKCLSKRDILCGSVIGGTQDNLCVLIGNNMKSINATRNFSPGQSIQITPEGVELINY